MCGVSAEDTKTLEEGIYKQDKMVVRQGIVVFFGPWLCVLSSLDCICFTTVKVGISLMQTSEQG